jgi:N-acetylated-alpha-linked acidic dipeptidase
MLRASAARAAPSSNPGLPMNSLLRRISVLSATLSLVAGSALATDAPAPMIGFSASHARDQAALEARFDAALDAREMRAWLERMSAEPNHVGSTHDRANAEFMLEQFKAWGWDAQIEKFDVLYPTPKHVSVDLVGPHPYHATLVEPAIAGDRTSSRTRDALPPYNEYGADGDVTGELVYVNYGMPDDYKELARRGISVKGKIAITRYGGGWRGLKPKLAYLHGAIGCLIYSDPKDDGYGAADTYPAGAGRPAAGLQRGSVADMPVYSGDPLTPNVGATADAKRLPLAEATTVLKIPVLPISYQDARPLLEALHGPLAPAAWRGGLPFTYHVGPGPARVHLVVKSDWSLRPVYDVVAKLTGSEFPDQWVVRGNHHDGWVFGADDPLSGNVAMMAEMKALGALKAAGWRPKRTIVYASWDGEEAGLLGSTEWVETHAAELAAKAVAYINSDSNTRGVLGAGGSHSLQRLVNEVAAGVRDPVDGQSVLAHARANAILDARPGDRALARAMLDGADMPLEPLGSGSDFTPFLQHAGIASLNFGFYNDQPGGVYHSIYDSFDHYVKVEDPELHYGVALAEVAGHAMMRLADADLLPLRTQDFASAISRYVDEVSRYADTLREETADTHRLLDAHVYELAAIATDPVGPPAREADVPFLSFAPLQNAAAALTATAREFDAAYTAALADPARLDAARAARANAALRGAEQALLGRDGLPGRPWYRHLIYAPGLYTGYGAKTLPGVREAVEERRWAEVAEYTNQTAAAIDGYRRALEAATAALR